MKIFSSVDGDSAVAVVPSEPSAALRALVYYRDLILVLLAKDFKVRYKSTFMGYLWSLIHPLAFASVFFVLFTMVGKFQVRAYALYLIAGLFPWQCISNTLSMANFYFLGNSTLIKKVRFHRATLVVAGVLNELIHFLVSIPVIVGCMMYFGQWPAAGWWALLPVLIWIQMTMLLGLALVVATSNLFFRDLERLTGIVLQLTFYATPIVYPSSQLPPAWRWLLWANPFAGLTLCWQGLFYGGAVPGEALAQAAAWAAIWLALGTTVYLKNVWRFAEIV